MHYYYLLKIVKTYPRNGLFGKLPYRVSVSLLPRLAGTAAAVRWQARSWIAWVEGMPWALAGTAGYAATPASPRQEQNALLRAHQASLVLAVDRSLFVLQPNASFDRLRR